MNIGGAVRALTGASVLISVLISITPGGKTKKAISFVCGIAVIAVMLGLFKKTDFSEYSYELRKMEISYEDLASNLSEANDSLNRTIIEEKCESYILDKAEAYGIEINNVSVLADWNTDGFWYPYSVKIELINDTALKEKLIFHIKSDLGISDKNIQWCCNEVK